MKFLKIILKNIKTFKDSHPCEGCHSPPEPLPRCKRCRRKIQLYLFEEKWVVPAGFDLLRHLQGSHPKGPVLATFFGLSLIKSFLEYMLFYQFIHYPSGPISAF